MKDESERQRTVELSSEGMANSECYFFNGFSHGGTEKQIQWTPL